MRIVLRMSCVLSTQCIRTVRNSYATHTELIRNSYGTRTQRSEVVRTVRMIVLGSSKTIMRTHCVLSTQLIRYEYAMHTQLIRSSYAEYGTSTQWVRNSYAIRWPLGTQVWMHNMCWQKWLRFICCYWLSYFEFVSYVSWYILCLRLLYSTCVTIVYV